MPRLRDLFAMILMVFMAAAPVVAAAAPCHAPLSMNMEAGQTVHHHAAQDEAALSQQAHASCHHRNSHDAGVHCPGTCCAVPVLAVLYRLPSRIGLHQAVRVLPSLAMRADVGPALLDRPPRAG